MGRFVIFVEFNRQCMFHTIITLSYTIPGIYLFLRIWQLFISRQHRFLYIAVFVALYSLYPLSNILEDRSGILTRLLTTFSEYLLPFFLYMFLLVLFVDLLLLINLAKIVPVENIRKPAFRKKIFISLISASILIVIAGIINFNTIRTTSYNIEVTGKTTRLKTLRIAFVSDFHLDQTVTLRFIERYAARIRNTDPDIILYGGDIVEGDGENIPDIERIIKSLKPRYGSFAVTGNHDRIRDDRDNFFTRSGIVLLRDSIVSADSSFSVAGRNYNRGGARETVSKFLSKAPAGLPLIVLDHVPTEFDLISRSGADMVFSGHTHKGQLFPINLYLKMVYELSYGHMKKNGTDCFVSSGIRLWGPPVRTTGKSEIVVVDVRFAP